MNMQSTATENGFIKIFLEKPNQWRLWWNIQKKKNYTNNCNVPSQSNTETLYYKHAKYIVK